MTDEEYKISILIRDAVFDNEDKTSVIGHYAHKAREIVEEVRINEKTKTIDEYKNLIINNLNTLTLGNKTQAEYIRIHIEEWAEELKGNIV